MLKILVWLGIGAVFCALGPIGIGLFLCLLVYKAITFGKQVEQIQAIIEANMTPEQVAAARQEAKAAANRAWLAGYNAHRYPTLKQPEASPSKPAPVVTPPVYVAEVISAPTPLTPAEAKLAAFLEQVAANPATTPIKRQMEAARIRYLAEQIEAEKSAKAS